MRSQLLAVSAAILFLSTALPAMSEETGVTTISATALSSVSNQPVDFTCTVESEGVTLGSFVTTQAGLTVQKRLNDVAIACKKDGYDGEVLIRMKKGADESLPAVIAPRFMVKAG